MKKTIIICILILFISCSKNKDPFIDVEFGKITEKEFIKTMKLKKVIIQDEKDTTDVTYFLNASGKIFPVQIFINDYHLGSLRKIKFNIGTETKEYDYVCKGCGPISIDDVDIIYNYYLEQYGKPDSLVEKNKYSYSGDIRERAYKINTKQPPTLDKTIPKSKRAVWVENNFILTMTIPFPTKNESKGGKFYYNMPYTNEGDVSINYEMKNYQEEFKRILDSIRLSLKPNDILRLNVDNPTWQNLNSTNSRLEIKLGEITRKDIEEPKRIKAFKYDIVITDSFDEELYRFENRTYDIANPQSYLESRPSEEQIGQVLFIDANMLFRLNYNNFSEQGRILEHIRNLTNTNKVKVKAEIKKILYEDNSILQ
ncbi:hypothetical protein [Flavobacterium psychrophilum]|uniref:hypothetical protein n=1 Tax=Flavobacterium psychrophilum TaxID=96345 RepID=UPI000B7C26E2|nr:hypothetical protein [Flavobacterium psychrophilum]MCB6089488.1 hypothetical protein [Flavobacterium psychrophilum]SNA74036.1 hypothetical protein DK095_380004 [Flavobacterium psychrophilum]